jgi:hypothetical protein
MCLFSLIIFFMAQSVFARGPYRKYKKILIPGAVCGNGDPYLVFMDKKRNSKWLFEFRPGGACWNKETCFGPIPRAFPLFSPKGLLLKSVFSRKRKTQNFLSGHSQVIFPYCTADIYAGTHRAFYGTKDIFHHGRINIEKSLKYLAEKGHLDWSKVKDLFVFGSSAGAFGTLIHLPHFDDLMPKGPSLKRTLILDSPGLHFGDHFWEKFTPEFRNDFEKAFSKYGIENGFEDGNLAKFFRPICQKYPHWNVGVIQSSRDIVMSRLFGNISQSDHESLIFSPNGLYESTAKSPNCSSWISKNMLHGYLFFAPFRWLKIDGLNALNFSKKVYRGRTRKNYVPLSLRKEYRL